ncbi:MAG: hypothetical protein JXR58_10335 [Bacteroidales bacterium]|nr:hypothetical protein [Bacteroidales bacterium]
MLKLKYYLTALFTAFCLFINAQDNIAAKLKTLSINPAGAKTPELLSSKIDKKGVLVMEPGVELSYEFYLMEIVKSVRFTQGLYVDGAGLFAGYSGVGMYWRIWEKWKNAMRFGIGPSINYRSTRYNMEGYEDDGYLGNGGMQHFLMLRAELEYNFYISKKSEFAVSTALSHPWGLSLSVGYRFWISRKVVHRKSCNC